ncbi:DUF2188 domain-containing protein [Baekduia soli]|nr:DUF2188 domain-containing protein [Baekduia soli]
MTGHPSVLHVSPGHDGAWVVADDEDRDTQLSRHADASEALRVATERLRRHGGGEVLVHDRYHHVHPHRCAGRV